MGRELAIACQELGIRKENGRVVTDSLAVARQFDKRHDNVVRNLDALIRTVHSSKLRSEVCDAATWFRRTTYVTSRGRSGPMYEMNRDGFILVVMGFTGEEALWLKIRYIQTFNAMEALLFRPGATVQYDFTEALALLRDLAARIPERVDLVAIEADILALETKIDHIVKATTAVEDVVVGIDDHLKRRARAKFSPRDKDIIRTVVRFPNRPLRQLSLDI